MKNRISLYGLAFACYVYGGMEGFDKSYDDFLKEIDFDLDMRNAKHRKALLVWLNNWGCRQFEIGFHEQASANLENWYEGNKYLLPPLGKGLLDLSEDELDNVESAYNTLSNVKASSAKNAGPTGATKILFTLRKDALLPWDGAIRKNLKYDDKPKSYRIFLEHTRAQLIHLEEECTEYRLILSELPKILGRPKIADRPFYSLVKLIDEYNWIVATKGCKPPQTELLEKWYKWTR